MQTSDSDTPAAEEVMSPDVPADTGPPPEAEEVDLWWGGYAPRTMVPSFVLCGALTLLIGGGALYLWAERDLPAFEVRYTFYTAAGIIWLLQLALLGYRAAFFSYRLTTRHLYRERGPRRTTDGQVDLASITGVRVRRGPIERLLNVGQVVVSYRGEGPRRLVLQGVANPHRVAHRILERVEQVQRKENTGEASGAA